jgi:LacI family transcriptional regulator
MKCSKTHKIALLFNASTAFDREVIAGVAAYLSSRRASWELFVEDNFRTSLSSLSHWRGDGIIAHFDDPAVTDALSRSPIPVVAVGGSYASEADYPAGLPYVATDNFKLVNLAYTHLIDVGLRRFAMFSLPEAPDSRWAQQREIAFRSLMRRDNFEIEIFRGHATPSLPWEEAVAEQVEWLLSLPKPVGIVAVTDGRARQLLQACQMAGIAVPEEVAVIGIDNDPLARMLSCIPLSSVIQGCNEIGRTAARMLHQRLEGTYLECTRRLIPPAGINVLSSSCHQPVKNPRVMRARHFIRQYACHGIRGDQVADYAGVSRSTLESYFQQELGCSVHDEILRFKLDAAIALLVRGDCSVVDVAVRCGFTSMQYLFAVFKRELGCTPREYQERVHKGLPVPAMNAAGGAPAEGLLEMAS